MEQLTISNWIAIIFGLSSMVGVSIAVANFAISRNERKFRSREFDPTVRATINRKYYEGGWRSVQLHIFGSQKDFHYASWRIVNAKLLRPRSAVLAPAENGDYARGIFFPESPTRQLEGKSEALPQRFALEFFIKFEGNELGQDAKFKVTYCDVHKQKLRTLIVQAKVPGNSEFEPIPTTS